MTAQDIQDKLKQAFDLFIDVTRMPDGISADTAFAIGLAVGQLSRARALINRDIKKLEDVTHAHV